ncbi:MAG TPA: glycoside hydrolase family 2 TIM barrel-domain containing protein [bacterium]|nr:glycoside hydrolase family 2 TIM barrel-domain containing protein [bacterium]HPN43590.1 glycoside hydrolase family 2 TIM barrel-domain containing protein [bacterium]
MQNETALKNDWFIRSSAEVKESGALISGAGYDITGWYPTDVPATVMAALVKNNVYHDPFMGNNLETIPTAQFKNSWWYRREFKVAAQENIRLIFEGINYSANIWLNGQQIASADTLVGAFRIFDLDITRYVNTANNILAVEVFPPQPGDFTIGFVDWNPRPPDANMGIWRQVKLRTTGAVSVDYPFVQSKVNLETLAQAELTISADLVNHSDRQIEGVLHGRIDKLVFNQKFSLAPHEIKRLSFSPQQYTMLKIDNPRLWWPNNLGEPNLYQLTLSAETGNRVSDTRAVQFGIREVADYINDEGHRGYKINGKKVLIRGGGWVDDLFLADDDKKIEDQIKYTKFMNLNTIRLEGFWGSSEKLYDLADQYGILLMAGWSCQWEWDNYLGGPVDEFGGVITTQQMELVTRYTQDQALWLRNHPALFVWVMGSDRLPRPALENRYNELFAAIDPTRPLLMSCSYKTSDISGPSAVKMNGPYDYVTPNYWYVDKKNGGAFGFNTETGPGPQPAPLESIKKMIPPEHLWPIDEMWNYHCGRNEFNKLDRYNNALNRRYGAPASLEEYLQKAQMANYEAIRAMFEAFAVNKYNSTGVIQWMLNSAWPELYWQLYDYYLMPNGAFYGTKTACKPVNIIYNYGDQDIYLTNDTFSAFENYRAEIQVFTLDSKRVFEHSIQVNIDENESRKIFELPKIDGLSSVYFVDLKLCNSQNQEICNNFYWLSTKADILDEEGTLWFVTPNKEYADFTALHELPQTTLEVTHQFIDLGKEYEVKVVLKNPSDVIGFFIDLNEYGQASGNSILPIFWDDNYISVLPGEVKEITGRFSKDDLKGDKPAFRLSGWNVNSL